MLKFFKLVNGKKFYCDEKGVLTQKDGADVEVTADDTTAVDVESGVDEATKMLSAAMRKAIETGDKVAVASVEKAMEQVERFFDAVEAKAAGRTSKVVTASTKTASFDVEAVTKGLKEVATKAGSTVVFELSTTKKGGLLAADVEAIYKATGFDYEAKSQDKADLTGDVIPLDLQPGMERAPIREAFIEQIADTSDTTSDNISYVEVTGASGAPATTAELATIPQKDYTFALFKKPVQKITVANKHSVEILSDGPELVSAIKGFLAEDVNIVTDDQLLSGNGTAPNLQGVLGVSTDVNSLIGAQILVGATHADVLRIAITKMRTLSKGRTRFRPNYIVLNPIDVEAIELTKDTTGNYVLPPFVSADGSKIGGALVIENVAITAGTFLLGDFRKLHVRRKGGIEMEITNSDASDFLSDIITVKFRRRLVSYVKANDSGAFMTGTFATIKTNLAS